MMGILHQVRRQGIIKGCNHANRCLMKAAMRLRAVAALHFGFISAITARLNNL
jgi:hypothetical protein